MMKRINILTFFTSRSVMIGTAFGAILLLARWITGNALMSSETTLIKYGLFFGIIYTLSYGIALFLLALFTKRIGQLKPGSVFIMDRVEQQTDGYNRPFFNTIIYLAQSELWIVQFVVLYTFSQLVFGGWTLQFLFVVLFIVIIIEFYTSIKGFYALAFIFTIILFSVLTFIPIYYFVLNGTTKIYEGIRLYHPYLLYYKNPGIISIFIAYIFIAAGHILLDFPTWFNLSFTKQEKRKNALITVAFIKVLLGFSFTAILMISIFRGAFENLEVLLLTFLYREESLLLSYLFGIFSIMACFVVLFNSLKSLKTVMKGSKTSKPILLLIIVYMIVLLLTVEEISLLNTLLFFGVINAVLLPYAYVIVFTTIRFPKYTFLIVALLITYSEIYLFMYGQILMPVISSLVISSVFLLFVRQKQKLRRK